MEKLTPEKLTERITAIGKDLTPANCQQTMPKELCDAYEALSIGFAKGKTHDFETLIKIAATFNQAFFMGHDYFRDHGDIRKTK